MDCNGESQAAAHMRGWADGNRWARDKAASMDDVLACTLLALTDDGDAYAVGFCEGAYDLAVAVVKAAPELAY